MRLNKSSMLVTGSTGFVGSRLCEVATQGGWSVSRAVRHIYGMRDEVVVGDRGDKTDWSEALKNIKVVIHLAARVHIMNDSAGDPLAEFRKVNTEGTLNLARQAAIAGIKRFIFISSIKVNGEMTSADQPFQSNDNYLPTDPYGLSKYEAEQGLLAIAQETGMEVVIIRPPLVYGPGVKANFLSMMRWINKGVPLPFGAIHNKRTFVALDNLVSFIIHCIDHPKAANEVFLISDGEDVSTTTLLRKVAKAFGKKSWLLPVPVWLMIMAAKVIGKADVVNRLFGSLQVDSSKARDLLGWMPVITMDEQLKKIADAT
jgi:nucleoside-diphosphate-sugar epimerase